MVNVVLTVAKVAGLAALPIMALVAARVQPSFTPVVPPEVARPLASFGIAMIAVLWTNEAWYFVTYAAGEIKDPQRNVPRALFIGVLAADDDLSHRQHRLSLRAQHRRDAGSHPHRREGGDRAHGAVRRDVHRADGRGLDVRLQRGRNPRGLAPPVRDGADGVFLPAASRVHPRYRTPHVAIVALTAWSMILALSGTYEQLFTYVMFSSILFSVIAGLALFRLRARIARVHRPYRAWGYPVVPLAVRRWLDGVRDQHADRAPVESLAGLGLLVSACRSICSRNVK